jgi:hypothetical protein
MEERTEHLALLDHSIIQEGYSFTMWIEMSVIQAVLF